MPGPVTTTYIDLSLEQHAMRKHGLLGRGKGIGNSLYAMDYDCLPPEARRTIDLIISNGPFPYPGKDGMPFGNRFGDLPEGHYLEYTVRTPGLATRGARRIVARKRTGQIFFTACHYERIQVSGGGTATEKQEARLADTAATAEEWRNGFYIVTGMPASLRQKLSEAIKTQI